MHFIAAKRKAKKISQIKLSKLSKISVFKISMMENGYKDLTTREKARLVRCIRLQGVK